MVIMSAVAAPPASFAARASAHVRGATSDGDRIHARVRAPVRGHRVASATGPLAMAPFRNPFAPKPKPDGPAPPSGAEVLMERVKKGRDKAEREGAQSVLADGATTSRRETTGTADLGPRRRRRDDAGDVLDATRTPRGGGARGARGNQGGPDGDPVEQARFGQHPLGWCESCAEENRLLDVSGGF